MLVELNIRDFAIIDRLSLRLDQGFNVLTGETGAGKSIIIDALGSLRGERVDPTFVRAGCERARVEGVFSVADCPDVIPVLGEYGLWDEEDDQIILTREVSAESGRSVARVNGRAVNASILREIGGRLVEICGQHSHQRLLSPRAQRDALDRFGGEEIVVLARATSRDAGARLGERIRASISHLRVTAPGVPEPIGVTVSVGVADLAEIPQGGGEQELLGLADARLLAAKAGGRNLVVAEDS